MRSSRKINIFKCKTLLKIVKFKKPLVPILYVLLSTLLLGCIEKNLEILGVLLADPLLQSHVAQTQVSSKLKICAGSTPSTLFRKCPKNMQLSSLLTAALDLLMAIDFRKLRSLWRERKVVI
jgi:hypothetical protein